jgi:methylated-DNA-[protein]-cysteine S-methyltransferase
MLWQALPTPIGELVLRGTPAALVEILFPNSPRLAIVKQTLPEGELRQAAAELTAYFAGTLRDFETPLAAEGTAFQKQVWQLLREIPFGHTTSYGALARQLGNPNASRAVGLANGSNPLPIIVPCHRVIGSTGKLTGFAGGLSTKSWLLDWEKHCKFFGADRE